MARESLNRMGELTIHWPDADAERVASARGRLEVAGERLRARSHESVLAALGAVFDLFSDADSSWRRELLERLPAATGLTPSLVSAGLEVGLAHWSGDALMAALGSELAPVLADESRHLTPFGSTSVSLAGCIPMPALLQCLLPLAVQSPVLVKSASRDRVTPEIVARSVAAIDPELGRCIEVVSFESDDLQSLTCFLASDCVVASGADETIESIRRRLRASQRFVGYGHKLSIAVVAVGATTASAMDALARELSQDIALWDQLGCLSPLAVYTLGEGSADAAARLGQALARELQVRQREWPRGEIDAATAATIRQARDEAGMRAADGRRVVVHASPGSEWTVIVEDDPDFRGSPGHRFVRVHPVSDPEQLEVALRPIARHLGSAALHGFGRSDSPEAMLAMLGASRICSPGRMQAPPIDWPHDGRPILLPLMRLSAGLTSQPG